MSEFSGFFGFPALSMKSYVCSNLLWTTDLRHFREITSDQSCKSVGYANYCYSSETLYEMSTSNFLGAVGVEEIY